MYVYDMNYNRCVFSVENAHDDAVSRVRVIDQSDRYKLVLTSSWDSVIKIWVLPLSKSGDSIRVKFLCELSFESSVVDFQVGKFYLASICEDGHLYIWKFDSKKIVKKYASSQVIVLVLFELKVA